MIISIMPGLSVLDQFALRVLGIFERDGHWQSFFEKLYTVCVSVSSTQISDARPYVWCASSIIQQIDASIENGVITTAFCVYYFYDTTIKA